jgi:hypothetical protein
MVFGIPYKYCRFCVLFGEVLVELEYFTNVEGYVGYPSSYCDKWYEMDALECFFPYNTTNTFQT